MRGLMLLVAMLAMGTPRFAEADAVIVYVDGSRTEVESYQVKENMVVFTTKDGKFRSVPLSYVDLAATEKANRESGVVSPPAQTPVPPAPPVENREGESKNPPPAAAAPVRRAEPTQENRESQAPNSPPAATPVDAAHRHEDSELSDEAIGLQLEGFPKRPKPLLELGSPFLGTGRIGRGFKIPGGAVWTPSFLLFGTFRSGLSVIDSPDSTTTTVRTTQWANRLDLFGNLYLSGSERFVFGLRPMDQTDDNGVRRFSGYLNAYSSATNSSITQSQNYFNLDWNTVNALFFEGDIGELFPAIDLRDSRGLDIGFSVGRQALNFQGGLLLNDTIDAIGLTQANLKPPGAVNLRITELFGWNQINRNTPSSDPLFRNAQANKGLLLGVFSELDTRSATMDFDVAYVRGTEFSYACSGPSTGCEDVPVGVTTERMAPASDGIYAGASIVGRPGGGSFNVALRVVASVPVGNKGNDLGVLPFGDPATKGAVGFAEFSWTPHRSENLTYVNFFYALDEYRAAALDPTIPGPLARAGILFAGPGLGNVPSALSPTASDALGGAAGHQWFFAHTRQQLLVELGARYSTKACESGMAGCDPHEFAAAGRYQLAVGRRGVIQFDAFAARDLLRGAAADAFGSDQRTRFGGRTELLIKF